MCLVMSLAFLSTRPTGLTNYALNILPHLLTLQPRVLVADRFKAQLPDPQSPCYQPIPYHLSGDHGLSGHLRRLLWTQTRLPHHQRHGGGSLLFCPVPEAPLGNPRPTVVMVHDLIPLRFAHRKSALSLYFRYGLPWILRQAAHIICNSQSTADDVMRFYGIPARKLTPLPLAYDAQRFRPLNLPRQPYFLYVGRSDPHKNLPRMIEALALLPKTVECQLWIGGNGDRRYTPQLQDQIHTLGLGDRVKFLGYVADADLPQLLNQAQGLLFPSLWEGFGLPVLEAMACGTPVITSNCAALPEVAGEAALLVDPYQPRAIAEALASLCHDQTLWHDLHRAGLAQAQRFSWQKTGSTTGALLQTFL